MLDIILYHRHFYIIFRLFNINVQSVIQVSQVRQVCQFAFIYNQLTDNKFTTGQEKQRFLLNIIFNSIIIYAIAQQILFPSSSLPSSIPKLPPNQEKHHSFNINIEDHCYCNYKCTQKTSIKIPTEIYQLYGTHAILPSRIAIFSPVPVLIVPDYDANISYYILVSRYPIQNSDTAFLCVEPKRVIFQIVARNMISRGSGGSIVNVSSQASKAALKDHAVYCATKAALDSLTGVMGLELGPHNVS